MEPLPSNQLGKRLCELFTYRWKWIEKPLDAEQDTEWTTNSKYRLKARVLWNRYQDAATIIGLRFGPSTKYAVIDIDAHSPYIDLIDDIKAALETIGIVRVVTVQSSWSGGIHIYCPLAKAYPTFSVACVFKQALEAQGFAIAAGELEVFPNCKAYANIRKGEPFVEYNGHRLPLQPGTGSRLLDDQLQPLISDNPLSRFFALWDNAVLLQDDETFREALHTARANRRSRPRKASGPVEAWREDLERIIAEGWTGYGQTNHLLKDIGTYGRVFERLSGPSLVQYIERIATSRPGYERWCRHQHEIWRRATLWARSVEVFYWPLGSAPLRDRSRAGVNALKAEEARERIAAAVSQLGAQVGASIRQLRNAIAQLAKTSFATLYKNLDLWHPDHMPVPPDMGGIEATEGGVEGELRSQLETLCSWGGTGNGGENEVWNPETSPLKNLPPGGRRGGRGGEEGFSTDLIDQLAAQWGWPL